MAQRGFRIGVLGATGAVGSEIFEILEQRRLPVLEMTAFASDESVAREIEFRGEEITVRETETEAVAACDLVFCAAPRVLRDLLPALRESDTRVIDLSGTLERDEAVPLHLPGIVSAPSTARFVAIPRGVVAGVAQALVPLAREVELTRATVVCLESASSAGLAGVSELTEHTVEVLNQMTGERPESRVFPQSLAFDCLPLVGDVGDGGESNSEADLRTVLRRLIGAPELPLEVTRLRIPTFGGSLAAVHLALSHDLSAERACAIWQKTEGVRVLRSDDLPTPRNVLGYDEVGIGRVRHSRSDAPGLEFVLALNNLRRGAALSAIDAAEMLLGVPAG